MTEKIISKQNITDIEIATNNSNQSTEIVNPVKNQIMRKITFDSGTLRNLSTMAAHYHFDKHVKSDELLSMMIQEITDYYYKNKFINELK